MPVLRFEAEIFVLRIVRNTVFILDFIINKLTDVYLHATHYMTAMLALMKTIVRYCLVNEIFHAYS